MEGARSRAGGEMMGVALAPSAPTWIERWWTDVNILSWGAPHGPPDRQAPQWPVRYDGPMRAGGARFRIVLRGAVDCAGYSAGEIGVI